MYCNCTTTGKCFVTYFSSPLNQETLDEMSILEALEAAHLSLIEQMEASPDLAQAVQVSPAILNN